MKFVKKFVPVMLSLAMCASMIAPAFAHTVTIEGVDEAQEVETVQAGVNAIANSDSKKGSIQMTEDANETVTISGAGTDVTIDLNGHNIDGSDSNGSVITVTTGTSLTLTDSEAHTETVTDDDGNETEVYVSGQITGGNAVYGGGVSIHGSGEFTMNDGTITGNTAGNGGGVSNTGGEFTMNGGAIVDNTAAYGGGGVYNTTDSKYPTAVFTMNDGVISNNEAGQIGGGVYVKGNFTMNDGVLANNTAALGSDDISVASGSTIKLPDAGSMNATLGEDGKPITGWYYDASGAWGGNGQYAYYEYSNVSGYYNKGTSLKAAHNEYVTVTYTDGEGNVYLTTEAVEKGHESAPEYEGTPERSGYTFLGWFEPDAEEAYDFSSPVSTKVSGNLTLEARWEEAPEAEVPGDDDTEGEIPGGDDGTEVEIPGDDDGAGVEIPGGNGTEIEIEDTAIPLASGPVTRAEFVDYLWRHEGQPAPVADSGLFEDVTEEHELSPAMAWAKSVGLIEAYEDGTFEPDELVTVGAVRSILDNFARVFGTNAVAAADLKSLTGDEDEAVLNCDEILAEFFGEEI